MSSFIYKKSPLQSTRRGLDITYKHKLRRTGKSVKYHDYDHNDYAYE